MEMNVGRQPIPEPTFAFALRDHGCSVSTEANGDMVGHLTSMVSLVRNGKTGYIDIVFIEDQAHFSIVNRLQFKKILSLSEQTKNPNTGIRRYCDMNLKKV